VKLDMVIATSACFCTPFPWNTFSHIFTLSLCLSLPLNIYKKQMFGSCFLIQSSSLFNGELRSLTFRIVIKRHVVVSCYFVVCVVFNYFLFSFSYLLYLWDFSVLHFHVCIYLCAVLCVQYCISGHVFFNFCLL
jgi:hypothetical protein